MMNLSCNVVSQPSHVAVFTFDDVLKDATRIRTQNKVVFLMLTVQLFRGAVTPMIDSQTNCPNCGWIRVTRGPHVKCYDLALFAAVKRLLF